MACLTVTLTLSAGTYCPTGSAAPLPCPLGQYCDGYSLSAPTGNCSAGFFCNRSAEVPDPVPCAAGYYCLEGTAAQEPCPPGTFASAYKILWLSLYSFSYQAPHCLELSSIWSAAISFPFIIQVKPQNCYIHSYIYIYIYTYTHTYIQRRSVA